MKFRSQPASIILVSLHVASCSSGDGGGSGIVFETFRVEVKLAAGAGAADCCHVALGADRSEANCCVAANFVQFLPFSVTFDEQGIDSRLALGLVLDASGTATLFFFDSDPTGSNRQDSGRINSVTCDNPILTENLCSDPAGFPMIFE